MAKNIDSIFFDITPKIEELALKCEQHTALCDHILKLFQLCFIRKFAEQKQVRRLLKSRVIRLEESSDKIFDIITSVIQIPLTRYRLSVYDF